jgi:hypothetical protein
LPCALAEAAAALASRQSQGRNHPIKAIWRQRRKRRPAREEVASHSFDQPPIPTGRPETNMKIVSEQDREKIAHLNAEKLFTL